MKFRKKPVVIEARQLPPSGESPTQAAVSEMQDLLRWCGGRIVMRSVVIPTLEGDMRAEPGDWIIRGVKGEFYPCKPDIFAASYERVVE